VPADAPANLTFHPIFDFGRLSLGRVRAQVQFYRLLLQVKPELLLVTTYELLLVSLLYKYRYGCKIVYDIQENYSLNLRAQHNYNWLTKHLLAGGVRTAERVTAPAIDHFLLAERSYAAELSFPDKRYTFVENKYKAPATQLAPATPVTIPDHGPLHLLYSGTIAQEYGIFEAIRFAEQLQQVYPATRLTIIGYCANAHTWSSILKATQGKEFIQLIGGERLVPHQQLLEQIRKSHIGLLPYRPNVSTFRCIPTKLYEYMANALPVVVQKNPLWQTIVEENGAGLSIDFSQPDVTAIYALLRQKKFYETGIPADIFWESEEKKLVQVIENLLFGN
ncbi:glycosyltransferase, partial [Pontibacter sp. HJ8]